jgi:hypothetical protein
LAKRSPSSVETCLLASRSHLFPMSMITMSGLPFYLTSSNHLVKWLNVSLLYHVALIKTVILIIGY